MASPVAHSLAGAIVYLACNRDRPLRKTELWLIILAANLADFDLIPGLFLGDEGLFHRTVSHSIAFTVLVWVAIHFVLTWRAHPRARALSCMTALALASQLLIDWLSYDDSLPQGIALLWPWSQDFFMSDANLFLNVRRDHLTTVGVILHNCKALLLEIAILGAPAYFLWRRARVRV